MTPEINREEPQKRKKKTWTVRRLTTLVVVALIYGVWFNFLDTIAYQYNDAVKGPVTASIGQIFGGNNKYQPWNIIGHIIPGLFMLFFFKYKQQKDEISIVELFIAGLFISTAVMDSPLWGVIRLYWHNLPLWPDATRDLWTWIKFYYNPFGLYPVWDGSWLSKDLPNAAMIFWSVAGRISIAFAIVYWQYRQERNEKRVTTIRGLISDQAHRLSTLKRS